MMRLGYVLAWASFASTLAACHRGPEFGSQIRSAPNEAEAVVYLYREQRFGGGGVPIRIRDGSGFSVTLVNGSFAELRTAPGEVRLTRCWRNRYCGETVVLVAPGTVTYMRARLRNMPKRVELAPVGSEAATTAIWGLQEVLDD